MRGHRHAPATFYPPGKTRYPLYRRLGGPQGRSGREENLAPTGIWSPDRPVRSQSLYRLSYPVLLNVRYNITNTSKPSTNGCSIMWIFRWRHKILDHEKWKYWIRNYNDEGHTKSAMGQQLVTWSRHLFFSSRHFSHQPSSISGSARTILLVWCKHISHHWTEIRSHKTLQFSEHQLSSYMESLGFKARL